MTNQAGIDDHNGENAQTLADGYKKINVRAVYPDIYKIVDQASAQNQSLRILDIGSGAGNNAIEMAKAGHYVVGVEPSDLRLIAQRDHAHPHIEYRDGLLPTLATIKGNEKFDLVVMSTVWQYIDPAERVASLVRIAETLGPNGTLALSYPSPPSRVHQYEVSPEMLKADIDAANALLPTHKKFSMSGEPSIIPDASGRKSLDGRELNFYTYIFETGRAKSMEYRNTQKIYSGRI